MSSHDIDKAFVSPIDKFLFDFDRKHSKSHSQLEEIKKHKKIFEMRDNPDIAKQEKEIWEEF